MKVGDLVRISAKDMAAGTLTAVKFYARLTKDTGGKIGIILSGGPENFLAQFSTLQRVIHRKFLEIANNDTDKKTSKCKI